VPVVDSVIDADATELFRPMEVVRTRVEAGPHSAVTKVPLFSDLDTISSDSECLELMSMISEDGREFRVALLDSLRGLGGKTTVCGAK
jgi:hypothetical protein